MTLTLSQVLPSFIAPALAAAGAAAVAIPILIHFLTRRPRRPVPWAAMRFLLAAYQKHRTRTRLEQLILLAMRCLLVLLIGLALAGPLWSAFGSLDSAGGRLFVIVLDNSLTSSARRPDGERRFDRLKRTADRLLASLGPGDRIGLITAARPAERLIWPPSADPAAVRRQLEVLEPSAAAADLPAALEHARMSLEESAGDSLRAHLLLLSDFSAGAVDVRVPPVAERDSLTRAARPHLLTVAPDEGASNVLIAAFEPDHRLHIPDSPGSAATAAWNLHLRRYAAADSPALDLTVRLQVPGASPILQPMRFGEGERDASLRIDSPLGESGLIAATASIEPLEPEADSLEPDNTRSAILIARPSLAVAVIDRPDPAASLSPHRWLTTVLAPVADPADWPLELSTLDPAAVDEQTLAEQDAIFVLRPDLLTDAAWTAIDSFVRRGGLAWVSAPATTRASIWPRQLADRLGLPLSIAMEPVDLPSPMRPKLDGPVPLELERQAADLPDLLRPVEFYRRFVIDPATVPAGASVLLTADDGSPMIIALAPPDRAGRVIVSAFALDVEWTNLMVKPLFVALTHGALRGAIDRTQPPAEYQPGDQPTLPAAFTGAASIQAPDGSPVLFERLEESTAIRDLSPGAAAPRPDAPPASRPLKPLTQPGVYRAETAMLAVNIDPDAADTTALPPGALDAWLEQAGDWRQLDADDPAVSLAAVGDRPDLTWPLFLAALILALAEMTLARFVSHARADGRTAMVRTSPPTA